MRNVVLLWSFCILVCLSAVTKGEAYKVFPACEDGHTQSEPDVSGDLVVWEDGRDDNVYGKYLTDGNDFPVSPGSYTQSEPVVSGNIVVWTDERGGDCDIYGYDISEANEFEICVLSGSDQMNPAIEGNIVVWQDDRSSEEDIYGYDLNSKEEFEICVNDGKNQYYPDVGQNYIAWMEDYNIYAKQIGGDVNIPVCLDSSSQRHPSVDAGIVVWRDRRNGNDDIYGYNLDEPNEFAVCTNVDDQDEPEISGNRIIWEDYRNDEDGDIYMYDLSSGTVKVICAEGSRQENPAIDGDTIVWEDARQDQNGDIYYAKPVNLQVISPESGEMLLAGGQTEIEWQNEGPVSDFVKLDYSIDKGDNWLDVNDVNVANTGSYVWDVPVVDSNKCLLKISDTDDETIFDVSDAVFTIFECSQQLTADLTGDCVVDISDFAELTSQWLDCGNPYDQTWCWGD